MIVFYLVKNIMSRIYLIFLITVFCTVSANAGAAQRTALVIGNSTYTQISPLINPGKDAKSISRALRSVGFDVVEGYDLTIEQMYEKVDEFSEKLEGGGVGLFFFAGHGVNVSKSNYLIPVKSGINTEKQVPYKSLNVDYVLEIMDSSNSDLNIVVLDACRNNPFAGSSRSATRGLARIPTPEGVLIAYATAEGQTAEDGKGKNGTYTKHILEQMMVPDLPIELMFKNVREGVRDETNGRQIPMEHSSIIGNFSFVSTDNATGRLQPLLNQLRGIQLARPMTEEMLNQAKSIYEQIDVIDSAHPILNDKNGQLTKLYERMIIQLLEQPKQAIANIRSLTKYFHSISMLSPGHKLIKQKNALIASAYLAYADELHYSGQTSFALNTIKSGISMTNDPRLITREASLRKEPTNVTTHKISSASNTPKGTPKQKQVSVLFRNQDMNCQSDGLRFEKKSQEFRNKKSGNVLAREYVIDRCQPIQWVYLNTRKTQKSATKLCSSFKSSWRLASKDELLTLITDGRYPGQGGMMAHAFFPKGTCTK